MLGDRHPSLPTFAVTGRFQMLRADTDRLGAVALTPEEIDSHYEANTGLAIIRRMVGHEALHCPAVLVAGHAPFCWGETAADAAHNAVILESVARMAYYTIGINSGATPISKELHDKHYLRKHGAKAYYGQTHKRK